MSLGDYADEVMTVLPSGDTPDGRRSCSASSTIAGSSATDAARQRLRKDAGDRAQAVTDNRTA